jgi:hypothetical protein
MNPVANPNMPVSRQYFAPMSGDPSPLGTFQNATNRQLNPEAGGGTHSGECEGHADRERRPCQVVCGSEVSHDPAKVRIDVN